MSASGFFVAGRIRQDAEIDSDVAEITKVIQVYTQLSETQLQRMQQYMSPELAEMIMERIKIINSGIEAHQKRLSTLGKIQNNQVISQSELEFLTMMPVFKKYEKYWSIKPAAESLSHIM